MRLTTRRSVSVRYVTAATLGFGHNKAMSKFNLQRYTASERRAEAEIDKYLRKVNRRGSVKILEELRKLSA